MSRANILRLFRRNAMGATTQEMRNRNRIIYCFSRLILGIWNIQMRIKVRFSQNAELQCANRNTTGDNNQNHEA